MKFRLIGASLGAIVVTAALTFFLMYLIDSTSRETAPDARDSNLSGVAMEKCCNETVQLRLNYSRWIGGTCGGFYESRFHEGFCSRVPPPQIPIQRQSRQPHIVFPDNMELDATDPEIPQPDEPTLSGNVTGKDFCGRLIYTPMPNIPRGRRSTGLVTAIFDVMEDGSVTNIRTENATSSIWRREVVRALSEWRYEPYQAATPDDECRPPFKDLRLIFEFRITEE